MKTNRKEKHEGGIMIMEETIGDKTIGDKLLDLYQSVYQIIYQSQKKGKKDKKGKKYWLNEYLKNKGQPYNMEKEEEDVDINVQKIKDEKIKDEKQNIEILYIETINKRNEIDEDIEKIIDEITENKIVLSKLNNDMKNAKEMLSRYSDYLKVKIDGDMGNDIQYELKCIIEDTKNAESIKCFRKLNNDIFKIQNLLRDASNEKTLLEVKYAKTKEMLVLYDNVLIEQVNQQRIKFGILSVVKDVDEKYEPKCIQPMCVNTYF